MNAFITDISVFLPNAPVDNEAMESILGLVAGKKSRARARVLRNNGIKRRYYAIDPATGKLTHNNAQLCAEAVRRLLSDAKLALEEVPLLACGTATPDQLLPAHGFMVHGELRSPPCEVFTTAGACTASMAALKYAAMAVAAGHAPRAVVTGSELLSPLMQAKHFGPELEHRLQALEDDPHVAFEYEFLRWMLSDAAGAALLENEPRQRGKLPPLKLHWLDSVSFAGTLDTCMYHLARKRPDGSTESWKEVDPSEWLKGGFFNMGQDARMLGELIGQVMGDGLQRVVKRREVGATEIDWFLPHISSAFFHTQAQEQTARAGLSIPADRMFTNLDHVGNVGCASVFLMLEELLSSGRATKGQKIMTVIPESARFNCAVALLEVM